MNAQIPTLYLLLAAVIGIFIGLLVASLFSTKETRPKKETPKDVVKDGFGEVARLWYSPAGKKLLVEMDGGHYKEFSALTKEQQAKALRLADLLKGWTGDQAETEAGIIDQVAPPSYVPIVPNKRVEVEEVYEPVYREPEFTPQLFEEQEELQTEELRSEMPINPFVSTEHEEADLVSVLQQSLDEGVEDIPPSVVSTAGLSITQQIGAILDNMLAGTELEEKGIRLVENEENGVNVWVGVEKYEGIDSVPYPQVRQMIRDAVLLWEQETESQQRMGG